MTLAIAATAGSMTVAIHSSEEQAADVGPAGVQGLFRAGEVREQECPAGPKVG
jgi:hypothetical protein